jgi:hypothetical protein
VEWNKLKNESYHIFLKKNSYFDIIKLLTDGRTWHGSGPNITSNQPRRGLGLHFVPVHVKWTSEAMKSQLWRKYLQDAMAQSGTTSVEDIVVSNQDFPITWTPSMEI